MKEDKKEPPYALRRIARKLRRADIKSPSPLSSEAGGSRDGFQAFVPVREHREDIVDHIEIEP